MFQIKDGRLYPDVTPRTLSFKVADGFWFDTFPEGNSSNCITMLTEDQQVKVEVSVELGTDKGIERELENEFEGTPAEELDGPYPITVGELSGYCIYCISDVSEYVALLDISSYGFHGWDEEHDRFNRIMLIVTARWADKSRKEILESLKAVVSREEVMGLLNSVNVK
ncbi:MAG: hypothetical protein LUG99_08865 [Lachnospiraceae bacterium]|nr:hypothetical protein [Lachnospiraceae bacterium]